MKKYNETEKKTFETMKAYLLQAFNVLDLDTEQNLERYKIDFAMFRIFQVVSCLDKYFLGKGGQK